MRTLDNSSSLSSSLSSFIIILGIGYLVLDVVVVLFILNGAFGVLDVVFRTKGVGFDGDLALFLGSFRLVGDSSTGIQSEIVDRDVVFFVVVLLFDFVLVVCVLIERSNACMMVLFQRKCSKKKCRRNLYFSIDRTLRSIPSSLIGIFVSFS